MALFCRLLFMQNLLLLNKLVVVLVARIRLLGILEVLIRLRIRRHRSRFHRTGYFLALQNPGSKSISTSAIFLRPCSVEIYEWLESHSTMYRGFCAKFKLK